MRGCAQRWNDMSESEKKAHVKPSSVTHAVVISPSRRIKNMSAPLVKQTSAKSSVEDIPKKAGQAGKQSKKNNTN